MRFECSEKDEAVLIGALTYRLSTFGLGGDLYSKAKKIIQDINRIKNVSGEKKIRREKQNDRV
jgi:hypothetical protein